MKFAAFSTLAAAVFLLSVSAFPAFPLEARTHTSLPSHLKSSGTFYRAVTGGELAHVSSIYHKGGHPASHTTMPGDFSHAGGLYVFVDINEAKTWGSCWAKVQPKAENKKYYLVKFKYTPNPSLKTASFLTGDHKWQTFVDASYKSAGPHHDIIEGPISVGHGASLQPYLNGGQMVWQAAFVGPQALKTLTIEDITLLGDKDARHCCTNCNLM